MMFDRDETRERRTDASEEARSRAEKELRENERKYRLLVENLQEGIWAIDVEGRTTFANSRMAEILGYTVDEMVGKNLFSFMDEEGIEICERHLERRRQGVKERHQFEFLRKDGTRVCTELQTSPITDDQGRYLGALAAVSDVTDRKRAEEHRIRLAAIVESLNDAIIGMTMDGVITSWNAAAEWIYGYAAEEVQGRHISILAPPSRLDETTGILERLRQGDCAQRFETVRVRKDGEKVSVSLTVSPIKDASGKVVGASTIVRDTTERKKTENTLRQREEELKVQAVELQGMNAALRILLKQREADRKEIEQSIMTNVRRLVMPYLDKLRGDGLSPGQAAYVDILESNINVLVSSFTTRVPANLVHLTPNELQIASLVKDGKSTKEIATLLRLSPNTIRSYRDNLRTKLGLKNEKCSLRSHLESLS